MCTQNISYLSAIAAAAAIEGSKQLETAIGLKNHTTVFTYKQLEKVFLNSLGVEVQNYSFASEDFLTAETGKRSSGMRP